MDLILPRKAFSKVNANEAEPTSRYVNVVRTDARFSTRKLRSNLEAAIKNDDSFDNLQEEVLSDKIKDVVHGAYAKWGEAVINALNDCAVYDNTAPDLYSESKVPFHLYDARTLTKDVLSLAHENPATDGVLPTLVSLDDMITGEEANLQEIAFSRLFSLDGKTQYGYVPRPGYESLDKQFEKLKDHIEFRRQNEGIDRVPLVLVEDNVRHAKMLNWLFQKMEDHGVLKHADVKEIASCFSCATQDELDNIKSQGEIVPVNAVVGHKRAKVDVITPRDLFFDGFVVNIEGEHARLPGIFMDYESRFKIDPDKKAEFHKQVLAANIDFCDRVEDAFGKKLQIGWFAVSKAVCHVSGKKPEDSMKTLLEEMGAQKPEQKLQKAKTLSLR